MANPVWRREAPRRVHLSRDRSNAHRTICPRTCHGPRRRTRRRRIALTQTKEGQPAMIGERMRIVRGSRDDYLLSSAGIRRRSWIKRLPVLREVVGHFLISGRTHRHRSRDRMRPPWPSRPASWIWAHSDLCRRWPDPAPLLAVRPSSTTKLNPRAGTPQYGPSLKLSRSYFAKAADSSE